MADKPIFHDASGRRAAWISLIGWAAAIVSTLVGVAFIMNLMAVPRVQTMRLPGQLTAVQTREVLEKKAQAPGLVRVAEALALPNTDLRLFGKPESFVRRRMGVALAFGNDVDECRGRAKLAASKVHPVNG